MATTTRAIRVHQTGGPEVLRWEEVPLAVVGAGEVRIRHTAVGLNFIDTYHRTGLYPVLLPMTPGSEAAGVVEEVGAGVGHVRVGDRVAYGTGPLGAYAERRVMPADPLVVLPRGVDDRVAAAVMLKGMTAQYLARRMRPLSAGDAVLVHAAAGGVGLLLCQWLAHLGVHVMGTVSTQAKADLARAHGVNQVIFANEDVPARVKELTNGRGAVVVYDSVGKDTFAASLDALAPRGLLVSFGQSSGPVGPFDPRLLAQKGSLFMTRPTLGHYVATRAELEATAAELFDLVGRGVLRVRVDQTYPLAEAARAHADLEARRTTGSTLLLP